MNTDHFLLATSLPRGLALVCLGLGSVACGQNTGSVGLLSAGDDGVSSLGDTSGNDEASGTEGTDGGDSTETTAGPECSVDAECSGEDVCVDGSCCSRLAACGDVCCEGSDVCSFGACVAPGAACVDSVDCEQGEYCEYALGSPGMAPEGGDCSFGATPPEGACLPTPPECPPGMEPQPGDEPTCLAACEIDLQTQFDPTLAYQWPPGGGSTTAPYADDIMMTPLVIQLDDDNCDGVISEKDIPEIVVTTFATTGDQNFQNSGTVRVLGFEDGALTERWSAAGFLALFSLASGNIDGAPGNEIVGCGNDGRVHALNGSDGTLLWVSEPFTCFMPALADLDGDGIAEIVDLGGVLDGATGQLEASYAIPPRGVVTVADVDLDGTPNIVSPFVVYEPDGSVRVDTGLSLSAQNFGMPTVVDLDLDGVPEIAATLAANNSFILWHLDANLPAGFDPLRPEANVGLNPGGAWPWTVGMGPITAGDVNADGRPDLGFTAFRGYLVFDGAALMNLDIPTGPELMLWSKFTAEDNGSTGSALFDFDGDGRVEVVYNDSERMHIYDGATGEVITEFCNTTGTVNEYPVIADVDNDGHADIVVGSNAWSQQYDGMAPEYTCDGTVQAGLRVYSSASKSWVRTRRIWNQHTYHVSNVQEDGTIPAVEANNWTSPGLNNFRQNKQPGSEFAAPDGTVTLSPICPAPLGLRATVQNLGQAAMNAGVEVSFYKGSHDDATLLGKAYTSLTLYPAQSEQIVFELPVPDPELESGAATAFAVIDDPEAPVLQECRVDNNASPAKPVNCGMPL